MAGKVPDAWDDDWEHIADKQEAQPSSLPAPASKLSRAERRAQHAEDQKRLWQSADAEPNVPIFLQAKEEPPLQTTIKPSMRVLSRRPKPTASGSSTVNNTGVVSQAQQDEDDSEEEERRAAEEARLQQKAEADRAREEKKKKYEIVRAQLFGDAEDSSSSNGNKSGNAKNSTGRSSRGRGSGGSSRQQQKQNPNQQLYDPDYSSRPKSGQSTPITTGQHDRPIREPRGPIGTGRGFAGRGGGGAGAAGS